MMLMITFHEALRKVSFRLMLRAVWQLMPRSDIAPFIAKLSRATKTICEIFESIYPGLGISAFGVFKSVRQFTASVRPYDRQPKTEAARMLVEL